MKKLKFIIFASQKMFKFLSNLVHFLDNYSRYAHDSFTLGSTSFLKKSRNFRSLGGSCEKWQPISQRMGGFHPPPSLLGLNRYKFAQLKGEGYTKFESSCPHFSKLVLFQAQMVHQIMHMRIKRYLNCHLATLFKSVAI